MNTVDVRPVTRQSDIGAWLAVPQRVFEGDPFYIPQLLSQERKRIAPKNPFFRFADVALFVAYDATGAPVGRISAQINKRYLGVHRNLTGHFGFFDTIDDTQVANALVSSAANWLSERGMRRMEGPFNLSINEECGLLVDGFESAPAMMMPHSRRWQAGQLENCGLTPVMNMHSFRMDSFKPPEKLIWLAEDGLDEKRVMVRSFDKKRMTAEIALMVDIFNDAWSENWGFVPLTADELEYGMHELLPFMRGHYGQFGFIDDRPVGFVLVLPNLNDIIAGFDGKLLPFNWAKLLWALSTERFTSGRMPLLGLRRACQGSIEGTRLFAALIREHFRYFQPYLDRYSGRTGHQKGGWIELSWILETNKPLLTFLRSTYGKPHKTYRIYGKDI